MLHESTQSYAGMGNGPNGVAKAKTAAIYARVSTSDQADRGYSLPAQIDECLKLAAREGYTVPEQYIFAEDYTGTSLTRPKLKEVRGLAQNKVVSAVIVYDPDRLARKLALQLFLDEEFTRLDVRLLFVSHEADRTPEGQMFFQMRGVFAEYERTKILARTENGRRERAKQGFIPGGKRTLGYHLVKDGKGAHYEIDEDEAAFVRRIFDDYVNGGLSLYEIARRLTREGVPTRAARQSNMLNLPPGLWQPAQILTILRNETYAGVMYYGKRTRMPGKNNPDFKTRWEAVPKKEWIAVSVPSIIDQETFDAAQARRKHNTRQSKRNRKHDYLLCNQRLRCGRCGRVMSGGYTASTKWYYYRCSGRQNHPDHPCKARISAAKIENAVWSAVERVLQNPALIAEELERQKQGSDDQQGTLAYERKGYEKQVAQCDKDTKRWEAAYIGEAIDLDDFKVKKAEIAARRHAAEQEIARLNTQREQLEELENQAASLTEYCRRVHRNLKQLNHEEKRLALEALDITAYWQPDKPLEIKGSIPIELDAPRRA